MPASNSPWYEAPRSRARVAFDAATAPGDRGAMLRELCRLSGGWLSLGRSGPALRASDRDALQRFGMQLVETDGQEAIILQDPPGTVADLAEALRLDPNLRQVYPRDPADALLLALSPHKHYRAPTQKAAVRALATMPAGSTLLATLPTGAGKSLLFQLAPSLAREPRACIVVIVPTVALALAHCETLESFPGLEQSACIHSGQSPEIRAAIYDRFAYGEIPVLLMSPEVALDAARNLLIQAASPVADKLPGLDAHLTHFVIDEAHIIESWGRTFRPDFQRLRGLVAALREANPELRTLLLSATVNDAARTELLRAYGGEPFLTIEAKVNRYEFDFVHAEAPTAQERDDLFVQLIDHLPRPAIVYTTLVNHAERLHERLRERGYDRMALFTGQMDSSQARLDVVKAWRAGHLDLVVATSAFGMGIDKDDVRTVVHMCVPESPSRYYQEIGRAARDGAQALALMLWTDDCGGRGSDWLQARRLWSDSWLRPEMVRKRWAALLRAAEALGQATWTEGVLRIGAPLDAFHDELKHGDTDYNRDWNRSLLNLLQRAEAITIISIEDRDDKSIWLLDVREPKLLASEGHDDFWEAIANLRHQEREAALRDLEAFREAVDRPSMCASAAIFELVEAGRPLALPCGRCAYCRAERLVPPKPSEIRFQGLDRGWPASPSKVGGVVVVQPERSDGLSDSLLEALAAQGVEQFVVRDEVAETLASRLRDLGLDLGLVSRHSDVLGDWRLSRVSTALVLDDQSPVDRLTDQLTAWRDEAQTPLWVVAASSLRVRGRPIGQALSNRAPLFEAALRRHLQDSVPT